MSTPIELPLMVDGTLPPIAVLVRWLAAVADHGIHHLQLDRLPPGNGTLPDLLVDAGIKHLTLLHPPFPPPFIWEGWSGGQLRVGEGEPTAVQRGELPWSARSGTICHELNTALDHARHEDALAVMHGNRSGADWSHLLATFAATPASVSSGVEHASGVMNPSVVGGGAWNPLAFSQRTVVVVPLSGDRPPAGLRNQRGVRYPVQVVDGPSGRVLLTSLALGALEAVCFEAHDQPVAGCHWEVTNTVLDNGRVRVELDALGQITRLCCDGRFVDWAGAGLQPMIGDQPLCGTCTITVSESGPIRGRIVVTRSDQHGTLRLTYSVHAHEPLLRLLVEWTGETPVRLLCPTMARVAPLEVGGDLCGWSVPQSAHNDDGVTTAITGLRWARLREADHRGLAVIGVQPMRVSVSAGHLSLHVSRTASIALSESSWPSTTPDIAQLALGLATPAVSTSSVATPALRVVGDGVVPAWISRPADWAGELLLCQPHAQRGRCTVFVSTNEAVRVDGRSHFTALRRTSDGDGFEVDLDAGDVARVRWR